MPGTEINASIITIGDELLIGQTVDTNSAFIARALNGIGVWVKRRVAVGDVREEILDSLAAQSRDSSVVIITGGLGPTADDITKPALCAYFGSRLVVNEGVLEHVREIFRKLNRPMIARNELQAEVPDNCTVLHNARGTAPGMWFEREGVVYISLPGVPYEMMGLIENEVLHRLQQQFTLPAIVHRTLVVAGKGESEIAELIADIESDLPSSIKLAYLPSYGMVKLRLTGRAGSEAEVLPELEQKFGALKERVGPWLVADRDISLEQAVTERLHARGQTLGTAESCTGGYIAHLLTSLPGVSAVYKGSIIAYANEVKTTRLNVPPSTLSAHGAVSEETVTAMARGALAQLGTDYALATSGIMGPDGGTPEKPVGTVWIAVASRQQVRAHKVHFRFDRQRNIELAARWALNALHQLVKEEGE
ncbi:MAG TPA: CinA family nicotinamide mononucleotide deamidase-related protein [Chitinophagaceae bacterium]|jgi:nicotinamide-nucleotide amidase|nr:CinA family nicotinamide mononucleotide deamidase-related protein [Chitinophagaceae bacterium]